MNRLKCGMPAIFEMLIILLAGYYAGLHAASDTGDVVGKVTVGYQGWFGCPGDGSGINDWKHWSNGAPAPENVGFELYPDVREYTTTYKTNLANLGNGSPARLFSSYNAQTAEKHIEWMSQNGIDCAAVQRFKSYLTAGSDVKAFHDAVLTNIMKASEKYGTKFYVMYDCSATSNVEPDWTSTSRAFTSSSAYARQNGKPVLGLWGAGISGRGDASGWVTKINWFKNQGCYVVAGVTTDFRTNAAYAPAFKAADMLFPWTIGRFKGVSGADTYAKSNLSQDLAYCSGNGQDYMATVFPGFAWSNWNTGDRNDYPRTHGNFMWRQFCNIRNAKISSVYIAMFDEYDEGTAIAKAAENASMIPKNQYFLTLDADSVAVSSDFYLRLANDGGKLIKDQLLLTEEHPTPHFLNTSVQTTKRLSGSALKSMQWPHIAEIQVFDLCGRSVRVIHGQSGTAVNNRGEIKLQEQTKGLPQGSYIVRFMTADRRVVFMGKFIK
jgi:hypothetical protein